MTGKPEEQSAIALLASIASGETSVRAAVEAEVRAAAGKYLRPENLGPGVNSDKSEGTPFIAPDGSYLLFNRDQVLGWIESFWPSLEVFLERGFGYCVANRYAITSWCLSVFTAANRFELGVATGEGYRRQGHASLATAACLEHCLLNDLVPEWHCWEDNLASVKLAEKVGFEQRLSYPAYRFHTGLVYPG